MRRQPRYCECGLCEAKARVARRAGEIKRRGERRPRE